MVAACELNFNAYLVALQYFALTLLINSFWKFALQLFQKSLVDPPLQEIFRASAHNKIRSAQHSLHQNFISYAMYSNPDHCAF